MSYDRVLTTPYLKLYFANMAKQAGDIFITGTIDDLCFYRMNGKYYVRMKSSLSSKKFWKHKAFEGARRSCSRFAEGNKLASRVYRMIEEEKRVYPLFCFLKKKAIQLLKEEMSPEKAEEVLIDYLTEFGIIERVEEFTDEQNEFSDKRFMEQPVVRFQFPEMKVEIDSG